MAREKILIVEDSADIIEMINYNLNKEGYRTVSVLNGEDAIPLVKKEHPDLIILDLMLPGIDGLEVCRTLKGKETTDQIPIIMLTGVFQRV